MSKQGILACNCWIIGVSLPGLFVFPVVQALSLAGDVAKRLTLRGSGKIGIDAELARFRVFADLRRTHGADGQEAQLLGAGVDDLMRGFDAASRTCDDVSCAQRIGVCSDANIAAAVYNQKHLFIDPVVVKRKRPIAGRDGGHVAAQLFRADAPADLAHSYVVAIRRLASRGVGRGARFEFDLVEVDNGSGHVQSPDCEVGRHPISPGSRVRRALQVALGIPASRGNTSQQE